MIKRARKSGKEKFVELPMKQYNGETYYDFRKEVSIEEHVASFFSPSLAIFI